MWVLVKEGCLLVRLKRNRLLWMRLSILIIFPSSYFDVNKIDEDMEDEYDGAIATGLFSCVIFGYDIWINEGKLVLTSIPEEKRKAVYRGWMMKPEKYEAFYNALLEYNIELITKPENYKLMHMFPNVYSHFGNDTAAMKIFPLYETIKVSELNQDYIWEIKK